MNPTAMHPNRNTRAPYRGRRHEPGVHPATRRVDLVMDELAARTSADAHAQAPVTTPVRRLARVRIEKTSTGEIAHAQSSNPYRTSQEARQHAGIGHLDGLPWYRAALPPAAHDCWRQTWHTDPAGHLEFERCPCGGARAYRDGQPAAPRWFGRNTRATGRVLSPSIIRRACRWLRQKGRPA